MLRSGYYMERVTVREINDFYENELRKNIKNKKRIINEKAKNKKSFS